MISAESQPARQLWLGYSASLAAAVAYGIVAVIGRMVVNQFAPPLVVTAFAMLFGTLVMLVLFQGAVRKDLSEPKPKRAWLFVGLAGCASSWGVGSFFLALDVAPVILVAPLAGVSPLISIALSHFFLQRLEKITWRTVVGAILVVVGVTLITVSA